MLRRLVSVFGVCLAVLGAASLGPVRAQSASDPVYVFHTAVGDMDVQLYPDVTPQTVANFLRYVNSGAYTNSFFHRSPPGFVVQGGGFRVQAGAVQSVPTFSPVVNEFHLSNTRGTIAMAKLGSDPNSATSQWFFNETNNAANLDNQNGGFTVFGKVLGAASLAVMDKLAAVPIYDLSSSNSAFNQIPLINLQSGAAAQISNLVTVSSITPAAATYTLWTNTDGRASVWTMTDPNPAASARIFGPYPGWAAVALASGTDGKLRLLWTNTDGRASVWNLADADPSATCKVYGPYAGWTAKTLTVGPDNAAHLLWDNSDGRVSVWNLADPHPDQTCLVYGPYSGWAGTDLSAGSDGAVRLLWASSAGQASLWNLADAHPDATCRVYGPYAGWTPNHLSAGAAAPRLLWNNSDGRAALWNLADATPAATALIAGPYAGWTAVGVSAGHDGAAHLLWDNSSGPTSGEISFWSLADPNPAASCSVFGPYAGWTAVASGSAQ